MIFKIFLTKNLPTFECGSSFGSGLKMRSGIRIEAFRIHHIAISLMIKMVQYFSIVGYMYTELAFLIKMLMICYNLYVHNALLFRLF